MADNTINVNQSVNYLNFAFAKATQKFGSKNTKGTDLYHFQTEYCYIVDDILRGPKYIVPKKISEANELIDQINSINIEK